MARPLLIGLIAVVGCSAGSKPPAGERLSLWHAFSANETALLNRELDGRSPAVTPTLLPFSRARALVAAAVGGDGGDGGECPDLIRIDATWLPGLASHLAELPAGRLDRFLPEARPLAIYSETSYGLPQSMDGIVLFFDPARVAPLGARWPPATADELVKLAAELTTGEVRGLATRIDGYWFVAFLRAWGGDVLDPDSGALGIDRLESIAALRRFAAMFAPGGPAFAPPLPGEDARGLARAFREGQVAMAVDGPWSVVDLRGGRVELDVAPFPHGPDGRPAAPFGGHLFAVPRCARHPEAAWQLAADLTAPEMQSRWAAELGIVPTTAAGLVAADPFVQRLADALRHTRRLPNHRLSPTLFDDLSPAVAAAVSGDATPEEALAGVARAWTRLRDQDQERAP